MTASAEAVYKELCRKSVEAGRSGDVTSSHCTAFNMVQEAVKRIIPNDPLNKRYALEGGLSNVFRIRKGRMRICWIASSKTRRVLILYISETLRKEGDAADPYRILTKLVASGEFDDLFEQMGVRIPQKR